MVRIRVVAKVPVVRLTLLSDCKIQKHRLVCFSSGTIGELLLWVKSKPGGSGWKQISAIGGPVGRQLKLLSGTIGKWPFRA